MSAIDKTIRKLLSGDKNVSFAEVRKIVEYFGYSKNKKASGEAVFHKKGHNPIVVPSVKGRKVKLGYIKRLIIQLDLEDYLDD
jgi:hypothetical protein